MILKRYLADLVLCRFRMLESVICGDTYVKEPV